MSEVELGKVDPKCWLCGVYVKPLKVTYKPLICVDCMPAYKTRTFTFVRATQAELDELFPIKER